MYVKRVKWMWSWGEVLSIWNGYVVSMKWCGGEVRMGEVSMIWM